MDEILMMLPEPRWHIPGATRRVSRNALFRFTSIILSNCPSSMARQCPWATFVAALFTRMSICPKSFVTLSTSRARSSGFPTWQANGTTRLPNSRATIFRVSCLRPQMISVAPSLVNTAAMALPMPRLPPVTIATFPSSCISETRDGDLNSRFQWPKQTGFEVSVPHLTLNHQMFRQPDNVTRVSLLDLGDKLRRQLIQFLFKEAAIAVGRFHIAGSHHISYPEHQEQIAVHASARGVAQIRPAAHLAVLGRQFALGAERPLRGEFVAAICHPFVQSPPWRTGRLFPQHVE